MARGSKVPLTAAKEWLEQFEHGARIDTLARTAGRTERTVKAHIDRARSDRDQHAVHLTLLAEAGRSHAADLRWALQYLRTQVGGDLPRSDHEAEQRFAALLKGAKQHLIRHPLWKQYAEWAQLAGQLALGKQAAQDAIANVVKGGVAELPPTLDLVGWRESFWQAASTILLAAQPRLSSSNLLLGKPYQRKRMADGWTVNWEGRRLAQGVAEESSLACIEQAHQKLAGKVLDLAGVKAYASVYRRMEAVRAEVDASVQGLMLRHLLPGHCTLCPG